MTVKAKIDLNTRGEIVQQLYSWYVEGRLIVNRRYQRKLVWSKAEKSKLIDTVLVNYPMPLILLAEIEDEGQVRYEIIDGMQRMDAIFSFIENKFDYDGKYFDTDNLALASQRAKNGLIVQKDPKLNDDYCVQIASYKIPISSYRIDDEKQIDEIFRRINSNGKRLSDQELRQAGVTGKFADLVRELSTSFRGDVSHSSVLPLSEMSSISLGSGDLGYNLDIEEIFWVRNTILRRDDIRDSKDEELVAHLVAHVVSPENEKPSVSKEYLDKYYGRPSDSSEESIKIADSEKLRMDRLAASYKFGDLVHNFSKPHDLIKILCDMTEMPFRRMIFPNDRQANSISRYYMAIYLAFYELMIVDKKKVGDYRGLIKAMGSIRNHLSVPAGASWNVENKSSNINAVKGILAKNFVDDVEDIASLPGITEFENIIMKSRTESSSYDFKQGVHRLDEKQKRDDNAIEKICETISAIANDGKNNVGYILIGVCDSEKDAERIKHLYNQDYIKLNNICISGIGHEARLYKNYEDYMHSLADRISNSNMTESIKKNVTSSIRMIEYYGHTVVILKIVSGNSPCFYGGKVFYRDGSRTKEASLEDVVRIAQMLA